MGNTGSHETRIAATGCRDRLPRCPPRQTEQIATEFSSHAIEYVIGPPTSVPIGHSPDLSIIGSLLRMPTLSVKWAVMDVIGGWDNYDAHRSIADFMCWASWYLTLLPCIGVGEVGLNLSLHRDKSVIPWWREEDSVLLLSKLNCPIKNKYQTWQLHHND